MANKRNENPNNPESTLYRKLTRLFSGPITTYRRQVPRKRTRRNLDNFKFTSASGQAFKRKDSNPYDSMQANFMTNQARAERYIDFDQMEYTPEIASGLDIYADEMTTSSTFNPLLNPPEIGILGVGVVKISPTYVNDELVPRSIGTLNLTFDHRAWDGAPSANFLNVVSKYLIDPSWMDE